MLGKHEIHPGGVRASIADWLTAYRLAVGLGAAFLALTVAVQIGATAPVDRLLEQHTGTLASGNWSLLALAADPFVVTVVFAAALLAMWRRYYQPLPKGNNTKGGADAPGESPESGVFKVFVA